MRRSVSFGFTHGLRGLHISRQQADDFLKGLRNGIADNHLTLVVTTYHAEHAGDGF